MTNNRHSIFLFGIKCLHLHMIGNPCNIGMTVTTYGENIGIALSLAEHYNISRKTSQVEIW